MKLLVAEPNTSVANHIGGLLAHHGFKITIAETGREAIEFMQSYAFDAVVTGETLDLGSPDQFLREMQLDNIEVPVVVIARSTGSAKAIKAIDAGAHDYIHPATPIHEVVARLRAVIRRNYGQQSSQLRFGDLLIDLSHGCARICDEIVPLTKTEYQILEVLAVRRSRTVSRETILDLLYGGVDEPEMKIIDVYVCKLRRKLAKMGVENVIQTVWGRGYVFQAANPTQPQSAPIEVHEPFEREAA